jgi:hypothetical protein
MKVFSGRRKIKRGLPVGWCKNSLPRILHNLIEPEAIDVGPDLDPDGEVVGHLEGKFGAAVVFSGKELVDARVVNVEVERAPSPGFTHMFVKVLKYSVNENERQMVREAGFEPGTELSLAWTFQDVRERLQKAGDSTRPTLARDPLQRVVRRHGQPLARQIVEWPHMQPTLQPHLRWTKEPQA